MHFILGVLGTMVTVIILFKRLSDAGIDLSWLNPFVSRQSQVSMDKGNPILSLSDPLEVAALMVTAIILIDGELAPEREKILRELFQDQFHKTEDQAADLLRSSVFLLGDGKVTIDRPEKILALSIDSFDRDKAQSVMSLLAIGRNIDQRNQEAKNAFIEKVAHAFDTHLQVH